MFDCCRPVIIFCFFHNVTNSLSNHHSFLFLFSSFAPVILLLYQANIPVEDKFMTFRQHPRYVWLLLTCFYFMFFPITSPTHCWIIVLFSSFFLPLCRSFFFSTRQTFQSTGREFRTSLQLKGTYVWLLFTCFYFRMLFFHNITLSNHIFLFLFSLFVLVDLLFDQANIPVNR